MTRREIDKILKEIFDMLILGEESQMHLTEKNKYTKEFTNLIELLITDESEERFQVFLQNNPRFLFQLSVFRDNPSIGFLSKPPISNFNFADFLFFSCGQSGCTMFIVEIERPNDKLFTQKLTPAKKLQGAIGQIHDWNEWIANNKETFLNTILRILKELPQYPKKAPNGSFSFLNTQQLERMWQYFGGITHCSFEYLVIIGRWSKLTEREQKRLMYLNRSYENQKIKIRTYDNFVRNAVRNNSLGR